MRATARRQRPGRRRGDPAIALINIVFLLLVFFLVASRIAAPLPEELELVAAEDLAATAPSDAVVIQADGSLWHAGQRTGPAAVLADAGGEGAVLRLAPDRSLPAAQLLAVARELRAEGADELILIGLRDAPGLSP